MKNLWILIPVIVAIIITLLLYATGGSLDPDSRFCHYRIYQKAEGDYEVWWIGRTRTLEEAFDTYEKAKAYQKARCKSLRDFMQAKPEGKRVL